MAGTPSSVLPLLVEHYPDSALLCLFVSICFPLWVQGWMCCFSVPQHRNGGAEYLLNEWMNDERNPWILFQLTPSFSGPLLTLLPGLASIVSHCYPDALCKPAVGPFQVWLPKIPIIYVFGDEVIETGKHQHFMYDIIDFKCNQREHLNIRL